jgi:hypothetical protein
MEQTDMTFKVQYLSGNSNSWTNASSGHGSEFSAIADAKTVVRRPNVTKVRVVDASGSVRWIN